MRIVRSLYARSKLEKYNESTNVIGKKSIYLRRKSGYEAKSRQKRSLKSWLVEFVITRKKVSPHERKLPTWIFTRPLVVLVRTFS